MSSLDLSTSSSVRVGDNTSLRLINSIKELPWYGGRPEEAYVVSGRAMKEITEELGRLFHLRESLADAVRRAKDTEG